MGTVGSLTVSARQFFGEIGHTYENIDTFDGTDKGQWNENTTDVRRWKDGGTE